MRKLKNNKGFTMIEVIFGFTFLIMAMSATQMTLNTILDINAMNAAKQAELLEYTSELEAAVSSVYTLADVPTGYTVTTLNNLPCYSMFDVLTTNNVSDVEQWRYYYKPDLVPADRYSANTYTRKVHTFVKAGTDVNYAYYFVVTE